MKRKCIGQILFFNLQAAKRIMFVRQLQPPYLPSRGDPIEFLKFKKLPVFKLSKPYNETDNLLSILISKCFKNFPAPKCSKCFGAFLHAISRNRRALLAVRLRVSLPGAAEIRGFCEADQPAMRSCSEIKADQPYLDKPTGA